MARIRIVDEWLRSPISPPIRARAVMVVAEKWAEQRVLMRAFANSADQTRPSIVLHGAELAISPAGVDPYGEWGIHVHPPADGRAQELRGQLELAARRLAGAKGSPPLLRDEGSRFETKATNHWAPGTPRDRHTPRPAAPAARPPAPLARTQSRRRGWTSPLPHLGTALDRSGKATVLGFALSGAALASSRPRASAAAPAPRSLANLVGRTVPLGFALEEAERSLLNALGQSESLSAAEVARIVGVSDGMEWMEQFISRLAAHGLDLVAPGQDRDGEPTYVLRR